MSTPDFAKGASGPESVYDTSPAGLGLNPTYLGAASARAVSSSGTGAALDYTEFSVPVTVAGGTAATATTVVTSAAVTFDGSTVVEVEFYAPRVDTAAANGATVTVEIYDGATDLGALAQVKHAETTAVAATETVLASRRLTPSAAAHTFSARAWQTGGNGTIQADVGGAAKFMPGYIKIRRG